MKKLLTAALTLTLALTLSTTAFAATVSTGQQSIDVKAKYKDNVDSPIIYDVDITWGEMAFTYTVSGTKTWVPDKHDYTTSTRDEWTASGNEITLTNHSNAGIKAEFAYTAVPGHNTVTGSFTNNELTLPTAEGKTVTEPALTGKTVLTLGGTLADAATSLTTVGTATVLISKVTS